MIMIRPTPSHKAGKPPPPVPPRPSKSAVAEALAKSRHHLKAEALKAATKSPTRQAPPPPVSTVNEILKSKSSYSVNLPLKKPPIVERSISEELKNTTRPVVYQSSNIKCNSSNNNNKVQITRDGDVKIVNRVESFRNKDAVQVVRRESVKKSEDGRNRVVQISRRDSDRRDGFGEKEVGFKENNHVVCGNASCGGDWGGIMKPV